MYTRLYSDAHTAHTTYTSQVSKPLSEQVLQILPSSYAVDIDHIQSRLPGVSSHVLTRLTLALQAKDPDLYMHSYRVHYLVAKMVAALRLSQHEKTTIELAALFHDIGKVAICDAILNKPSDLTASEFAEIRKHPGHGAMIVHQAKGLKSITPLIYYHHERWDGGGYPYRIRGRAIPDGARIIAIADAFDVITSPRPYQAARSASQGLEELCQCADTQFDPFMVDVFCRCFAHFEQ